MRLIDADAVLAALGIFHRHDNDNDNARHFMNGIETAVEIIEDAPDARAVHLKPVVFCQDCKRRLNCLISGGTDAGNCNPYWYCADGEREADE